MKTEAKTDRRNPRWLQRGVRPTGLTPQSLCDLDSLHFQSGHCSKVSRYRFIAASRCSKVVSLRDEKDSKVARSAAVKVGNFVATNLLCESCASQSAKTSSSIFKTCCDNALKTWLNCSVVGVINPMRASWPNDQELSHGVTGSGNSQ